SGDGSHLCGAACGNPAGDSARSSGTASDRYDLGRHPKRDHRHVVSLRSVSTKISDRTEHLVDDHARGLLARLQHDFCQPLYPELAPSRIGSFEDAIRAEYIDVADGQIVRHLIVRRTRERTQWDAGKH